MTQQPMSPPTESLTRSITAEERATYARDGVVHLRSIYPAGWVSFLEQQLVDAFDNQPQRAMEQRAVTGDHGDGLRVDVVAMAEGLRAKGAPVALQDTTVAKLTGRSLVETDASAWHVGMRTHNVVGPLPELVAALTSTNKIVFYSDQLFLKEAGSQVRTPFHQDQPYFLVEGEVAVCWVPVDTVTSENGPMGYVRGSHRWGKLFKPSDFITETGVFPETDGLRHGDLEQMPKITDAEYDLVYFDAEPGDVIVHHWSTVHGSAGNISAQQIRRAASVRYALGESTYYQRPSSPEPFRNTTGLNDGDRLDKAERFAVVWPR